MVVVSSNLREQETTAKKRVEEKTEGAAAAVHNAICSVVDVIGVEDPRNGLLLSSRTSSSMAVSMMSMSNNSSVITTGTVELTTNFVSIFMSDTALVGIKPSGWFAEQNDERIHDSSDG